MRLRAAGAIGEQSWGRKFGHFLLKVEPWLLGGFSPGGPTGGIIIPDTAKEKPQQGTVLAVGPGKRSDSTGEIIPVGIEVGQTVLYSKYGGTEIAVDGDDVLVLNARDILAIVEN